MVIKPVPHGIIKSENGNNGAHHIIYKRSVESTDQLSDFGKKNIFILVTENLFELNEIA